MNKTKQDYVNYQNEEGLSKLKEKLDEMHYELRLMANYEKHPPVVCIDYKGKWAVQMTASYLACACRFHKILSISEWLASMEKKE